MITDERSALGVDLNDGVTGCACIGPMYGVPYCPCEMARLQRDGIDPIEKLKTELNEARFKSEEDEKTLNEAADLIRWATKPGQTLSGSALKVARRLEVISGKRDKL